MSEEESRKIIARLIKRVRLKKKMSVKDLAEKIEVSKETIYIVESGKRLPYLAIFIKMLNALDLKMIIHETNSTLTKQ